MIINVNINNDFKINCLTDLAKLNMEEIKVNKSKVARDLKVSRKTVRKYMEGFKPKSKRNKSSKLDLYYKSVYSLLYNKNENPNKIFHYKRNLYYYLIENNIMPKVSESTFKDWLKKNKLLNDYFKTNRSNTAQIRVESKKGYQAQVDWKENIKVVLNTGEIIEVNILVVILSYSRFRYYGVSLTKTQDILFNHLDNAFKNFGGVPESLLTDNMKSVMDEPRTEYQQGKINNKFKSFADDYGFKVIPCIAGRPQTKAKVEQPMRVLDSIQSYNNDLDYDGLIKLIQSINERENNKYHESYGLIPKLALENEKGSLLPLPKQSIRNQYNITNILMKVDASSLITFKTNKYSVPPKYLNKTLVAQIYDNKLHVYFNTELVTIHNLETRVSGQMFYHKEHYTEILEKSQRLRQDDIERISQKNLEKIGEKFNDALQTINIKS